MINFKFDINRKPFTVFDKVNENQFFLDMEGFLCQKFSKWEYHTIADKNGQPCALRINVFNLGYPILKIFDKVVEISWEK